MKRRGSVHPDPENENALEFQSIFVSFGKRVISPS